MLNEINKKVKKGNHLDRHSDDEGLAVHYQISPLAALTILRAQEIATSTSPFLKKTFYLLNSLE